MKFTVCDKGESVNFTKGQMYLRRDMWDDFSYKTAFDLIYCDSDGNRIEMGWVKIAFAGMEPGSTFGMIPHEFLALEDGYYSLGQNVDYYDRLRSLKDETREEVLTALNDVAFNLNLLDKHKKECAMRTSLLRDISPSSISEQFHRVATGGVPLTKYNFTYVANQDEDELEKIELSFEVVPSSTPPTNIQAIIGTNGTGKTTLVKDIVATVYGLDKSRGSFTYKGRDTKAGRFANVVVVAFSPFDNFSEINGLVRSCQARLEIPYTFIGLEGGGEDLESSTSSLFVESLKLCKANPHKRELWNDSIEFLKSDPVFARLELSSLMSLDQSGVSPEDVFSALSSGHKVVLLIVTCCVAHVAEKSLIVVDEPENHLHPPLLSALIRALSYLLIDRNGVAIISTHSPVVLQEIPKDCVWKLRRVGERQIAERPAIQTFGANAGTLISEVFGLEVTKSGFHKMIEDAVEESDDFDDVEETFDCQLGDEALILARALFAIKHRGENND